MSKMSHRFILLIYRIQKEEQINFPSLYVLIRKLNCAIFILTKIRIPVDLWLICPFLQFFFNIMKIRAMYMPHLQTFCERMWL